MLLSLTFVVIALIEFAVAVILNRMGLNKSPIGRSKVDSRERAHSYTGVESRDELRWYNNPSIQTGLPRGKLYKKKIDYQTTEKKWISMLSAIDELDFAAFWMFFILYLSFNCVYWIYFLDW